MKKERKKEEKKEEDYNNKNTYMNIFFSLTTPKSPMAEIFTLPVMLYNIFTVISEVDDPL